VEQQRWLKAVARRWWLSVAVLLNKSKCGLLKILLREGLHFHDICRPQIEIEIRVFFFVIRLGNYCIICHVAQPHVARVIEVVRGVNCARASQDLLQRQWQADWNA
jgi:hypothetical protein